MIVNLKTQQLSSLEQVRSFMAGTAAVPFAIPAHQDRYHWVAQSLKQFGYRRLRRAERGLIVRFLCKVTGYSRAQVTRLIAQWRTRGRLTDRRGPPAAPFAKRYGAIELRLLAEFDQLHGTLSGPATKKLAERALTVYRQPQYETLAGISVSHLYNLRRSSAYRRIHGPILQHTRPTAIPIGERRKPNPQGKPGYLRVDSVHQGDFEGVKGVYLINAVDEITQFEFVGAVARISELFLLPTLAAMLEFFPFVIRGFHSDNGSEYVNHRVAKLLNKLHVEFTKSRSRHSNDNALAESKNASIVRKHLGYQHIPSHHAQAVNTFTVEYLTPYLNFHRPCFFARIRTNNKGRIEKLYRYEEMMTPYDKLKSLPQAHTYLKSHASFPALDALALSITDNQAVERVNKARTKLFDKIRHARKCA
jgi:transposase InsO family protein